jgi:hypothetical protein
MLGVAVASWIGWVPRDPWYFLIGLALFVAGYQGCFVVPVLHRRLNEIELRAGRQFDAHAD